jgi:A/G-specific adenine glycosylase
VPVDPTHALLAWYAVDKRALPWRYATGETPDPYRVWLSEIMLQQTMVAAVKPYFAAFTERWPTVEALAAANEAEVMRAWAGLGYYARARNLLACARAVAGEHEGRFPEEEVVLRTLPGIGAYTAAAIAAIAFGKRAVVVDGNVERVVARLFAVAEPIPGARARLRALTDRLTPEQGAGDFAQAMMDLGATICTPRGPNCARCPVAESCAARAEGRPEAYPVKIRKASKPRREWTSYWLQRGDEVLLVRRPSSGLLGGMLALPVEPPADAVWQEVGTVEHVFTHFALTMKVVAGELKRAPAKAGAPGPARKAPAFAGAQGGYAAAQEGEWWPVERVGEAGLPTLFAKAAALGMAA